MTVGFFEGGLTSDSSISAAVVAWLLGTTAVVILFVLGAISRVDARARKRHAAARRWAEETFVRQTLYNSEQETRDDKLDKIETAVERTRDTVEAIRRSQLARNPEPGASGDDRS